MKRTIKAKIILQQHFGNADGGDGGSRWYTSEPVTITFDEPMGSQLACGYEVVGAEIEQDVCYICGEPLGNSFQPEGDGRFYHMKCKYPPRTK